MGEKVAKRGTVILSYSLPIFYKDKLYSNKPVFKKKKKLMNLKFITHICIFFERI